MNRLRIPIPLLAVLASLLAGVILLAAFPAGRSRADANAPGKRGRAVDGAGASSGGSSPDKKALVKIGSPMRYVANTAEPGFGSEWTTEAFDDSKWPSGVYGAGHLEKPNPKTALTSAPRDAVSIFTRAAFTIRDVSSVRNLYLSGKFKGARAVWINGVAAYRSPGLAGSALGWNAIAHPEDPNGGTAEREGSLVDLSTAALPVLHNGKNLLAVGVWSSSAPPGDLLVAPNLSINRSASLTRGPYLQLATPTGLFVRWRTELPSESLVRYGPEPGALTSEARDAAASTEHVVGLSGLRPSTTYYYSVGTGSDVLAGGDADHAFVTPPAPGTVRPLRVWVLGDSGTADAGARSVRDAYEKVSAGARTDLWLMLGDNAYPDGTDAQYQAAVFEMYPKLLAQAVVWPASGNHDEHSREEGSSATHALVFTLPEHGEAGGVPSESTAYYSFDQSNVHFVCLDSCTSDRSSGGAMLTWLRKDLAATKQEWIVAYWHHAPYSRGSHDSDRNKKMTEMRANALPILEEGGVDLVMGGHSHVYERSFLIDGHYGESSTFVPSMKLDPGNGRRDGDGAYVKRSRAPARHEGAVYIVAGCAGHTGGGTLNHPAMCVSMKSLGSVVLEVNGDELDESFLDARGVVRDHFTIVKGRKK